MIDVPSFGFFVIVAVIASSVSIYSISRSVSTADNFYSIYNTYYNSQRLMLFSVYAEHYASSNGNASYLESFVDSMNASLGMDGFRILYENGTMIIYSKTGGEPYYLKFYAPLGAQSQQNQKS